jgi:hypothetical protein
MTVNPNKPTPKYNVGDSVYYIYTNPNDVQIIELVTIESVVIGDFIVWYEIEELSELVMEAELIPSDNEEPIEVEETEINFVQNYEFGDQVSVIDYEGEAYKVAGILIEIHRYPDEEWTDVSYELERVTDGLCIYAYDEDMAPYNGGSEVAVRVPNEPKEHPKKAKRNFQAEIDSLLDDYNEYMTLYRLFGDKAYKELAESVLETLEHCYVVNKEDNHE